MVVEMMKWDITPCKSVGNISFGQKREDVRKILNLPYHEMKKSIFSKNTMDAYERFHVYYNNNNEVNALEIFDGITIFIDGKKLFPGSIKNAQRLLPDLMQEGDSFISKQYSIGLTVSVEDANMIEGVLSGCNGYYN